MITSWTSYRGRLASLHVRRPVERSVPDSGGAAPPLHSCRGNRAGAEKLSHDAVEHACSAARLLLRQETAFGFPDRQARHRQRRSGGGGRALQPLGSQTCFIRSDDKVRPGTAGWPTSVPGSSVVPTALRLPRPSLPIPELAAAALEPPSPPLRRPCRLDPPAPSRPCT